VGRRGGQGEYQDKEIAAGATYRPGRKGPRPPYTLPQAGLGKLAKKGGGQVAESGNVDPKLRRRRWRLREQEERPGRGRTSRLRLYRCFDRRRGSQVETAR